MDFALPTAFAALALAVLLARARQARAHRGPLVAPTTGARAILVLDLVEGGDPDRLSRLVREAGMRALEDGITEVEVRSRTGAVLGIVRHEQAPAHPVPAPGPIVDPRLGGRTRSVEPAPVHARFDARERPAPQRSLADRFDLPSGIRHTILDPNDLTQIVEAILTAAGMDARRSQGSLRVADTMVIALGARAPTVMSDELTRAYLSFLRSGAARALVIHRGVPDAEEIHRRERLAPKVRHVGLDAIQRMADAVALGHDPLAFALGAPTLSYRVSIPS